VASVLGVIVLAEPWERGRLWRTSFRKTAPALVIAIGVLVAWEILIGVFQVRQFLLPKPTAIGQNLLDTYPDLISKTWVTLQNALWGYAIGCSAGMLVGLASARFAAFSRAILPFAIAINSTPLIAFAPIMGFWFGVTRPESKIAVVAIMVFFPVMINTVRGLLSAEQNALELMRSLACTELTVFRKVRFPAALPYIFNGLKFSTTWSVIGAVVAEFFGGTTLGIGFYIKNKPTEFNFPAAWSAIVVVSVIGILFYMIVSLVERVVMPWHVTFREGSR
jgi:NitT/TauT family transport system permease protein